MSEINALIERLIVTVAEYAVGTGDHAAVVAAKEALRDAIGQAVRSWEVN